jgi:hypothetical protein
MSEHEESTDMATDLDAEVERLRAEIELSRRIVFRPLEQTEAEVKALEPGNTPMACRLIDLANLKSAHEAGVRLARELRAERDEARSEVERLVVERDKLRLAVKCLLKNAASEEFWQRQSVDHWDKPGPHNAAIRALKAILFAKHVIAPPAPVQVTDAGPEEVQT